MATIPTPYQAVAGTKASASAFNAGVQTVFQWLLTNFPRVHVYNAATQSLPNSATYNLILWDTEGYDTDNMHSTVTNISRVVFPTAGLYYVDVMISLATGTYTTLNLQVNLNSGGVIGGGTALRSQLYDQGAGNIGPFTFYRFFNAGDYVEIFAAQVSGGPKSTAGNQYGTRLFAQWIATS